MPTDNAYPSLAASGRDAAVVARALRWFQTEDGAALYRRFQAEYLRSVRRLFIEIALARLGRPPRRILDVGCGAGDALAYLAERVPAAELHGIDPEAAMLEEARDRLGARASLAQVALEDFAGADGSFDLVLAYSNFRFWARPADGLAAAWRLLATGGLVYLLDLDRGLEAPLRSLLLARIPDDATRGFLRDQLDAAYALDEVHELLRASGVPRYQLAAGGLGGHAPTSLEAIQLMQQSERIYALLLELPRTGFKVASSASSVFHLFMHK